MNLRWGGLVLALAAALSTCLIVGIAAALMNIPNFIAKKMTEECLCMPTLILREPSYFTQIGDLMVNLWLLVPTLLLVAFSALIIIQYMLHGLQGSKRRA